MKTRILVNPRAGSGAAATRVPAVELSLRERGHVVDLERTRGPGDATRIIREAREEGVDCVVIVGGDGTLNEACQAYLDDQGRLLEGPELAIVPAGTGGDFRKTFDLGTDTAAAVARMDESPGRRVDLGVAEFRDHRGTPTRRAFVNILSFGLGGLTDRVVAGGPKWVGGRVAFFTGALRALFAYQNLPVRLTVDGASCLEAPILNVAIANGRYFGAGMKIAPEADPSDGQFDVVALYDLTRAQGLGLAYKIYRGTHPGSPGVRVATGREIHAAPARSSLEVLIDLDGETPGRLPLDARIIPGALRFRI
ncbi:MAG: diacylglycerol kinase family lipid kinase [Polyangiaceae bacterium]|nr:diacylglycerol kinase family lipid kinase [Polyangiaceae bacterium]